MSTNVSRRGGTIRKRPTRGAPAMLSFMTCVRFLLGAILCLNAVAAGAQTCVDDFERFAESSIPYPEFYTTNCATFHGGHFARFQGVVPNIAVYGGVVACKNTGSYCKATTEINIDPAAAIEFDLAADLRAQVETVGFSQWYPSQFGPPQNGWIHVVIPRAEQVVKVTSFGGQFGAILYDSGHHMDNLRVTRLDVPAPKFQFELDDRFEPQKVLLHRYQATDVSGPFQNGYYSAYQVPPAPPTPPQPGAPLAAAVPAVFRFPGTVQVGGVGTTLPVYFRVIDPPDTAAYLSHPVANDNLDPTRPKGTLFYADAVGNRVSATPGGVLKMTAFSDGVPGRAQVLLETSANVAGENYQIEASFEEGFSCATAGHGGTDVCAKSVVVTTWKRIYIENDAMFRRGAFLVNDVRVGDRELLFQENRPGEPPPFLPGETLALIHAETLPFYQEDVTIDPVPAAPDGTRLLPIEDQHDGTWLVRLSAPVQRPFLGRRHGSFYYADAAGIEGSYYVADLDALRDFYATMFVDVQPLAMQPYSSFPFMAMFNEQPDAMPLILGRRHFFSAPPNGEPNGNVIHVIGASYSKMNTSLDPTGTRQTCNTNFGDTQHGRYNFSYIYVGNIEATVAGPVAPCTFQLPLQITNMQAFNRADVAHETVHQFYVNHTTGPDGHCVAPAAAPPAIAGDLCLMNRSWPIAITNWDQLNLPRLGLHWLQNGSDSEYTEIRTHAEPVTQQ